MTDRLLVDFSHAQQLGYVIVGRALREYSHDLRAARAGDTAVIWSIDTVHAAHL